MRNHAPILLQQIKTKMLTTKQKICYYKHRAKRKQNIKQNGEQNKKELRT